MTGQRSDPPRVAELRVHGVSGTPVEEMLDDPYPRQVAGDESGRFFRRTRPVTATLYGGRPRTVESYHWGRYTAGSPSRALWLLLIPFALVNLARFAMLMPHRRRHRDRIADAVLRLLGLVLTVTLVVTACYVAWEVAARQCAAAGCAADSWWLRWFADRSTGVRVLVAAVLPAAVLALMWTFGRQAFGHEPPGATRQVREGSNGSLDDPGFWRGAAQASRQRTAHVWMGCAVVGGLGLATLGLPGRSWTGGPAWFEVLYIVLLAGVGAGAVIALVLVVADPHPRLEDLRPDDLGRDTVAVPRWMRRVRWGMAGLAAICVLAASWGADNVTPTGTSGTDAFETAVNLSGVLSAVLLVALLVQCVVQAFVGEPGRRLRRGGTTDPNGRCYPKVPSAYRPFWSGCGAWMIAALGVTIAFGFSTAAVFWSAKAMGRPVVDASSGAPARVGQEVELALGYWVAAVVWGVLAGALLLGALPLVAWMLGRRPVWVSVLVLAAATLAAAGAAGHEGSDLLGDRAEFYLPAGLLVAGAVALCVTRWRSDDFDKLVADDYGGGAEIGRGRAKVARAWRLALVRYRYHHAGGVLATLGGLAVIASAAAGGWMLLHSLGEDLVPTPEPLADAAGGALGTAGVAVVTALAGALLALGLATWRTPSMRTSVGILWDLLSFWPRVAHPLCPPPYGGRAVLAVAERCSQLVNDDLVDGGPADTVVLSGHSQGSVITLAACAVLDELARRDEDVVRSGSTDWLGTEYARRTTVRLAMVTYGSQLQFIYPRMFPTYFGYYRLRWIYNTALRGRWRSFYRWTDPLGGPVLSWPHQGTAGNAKHGPAVANWTFISCPDAEHCGGHEPVTATTDRPGLSDPDPGSGLRYWRLGPDIRLRDPAVVQESARQPRLAARRHGGYPSDPVFDLVVAQLADDSVAPPPACAGADTNAVPTDTAEAMRMHDAGPVGDTGDGPELPTRMFGSARGAPTVTRDPGTELHTGRQTDAAGHGRPGPDAPAEVHFGERRQ